MSRTLFLSFFHHPFAVVRTFGPLGRVPILDSHRRSHQWMDNIEFHSGHGACRQEICRSTSGRWELLSQNTKKTLCFFREELDVQFFWVLVEPVCYFMFCWSDFLFHLFFQGVVFLVFVEICFNRTLLAARRFQRFQRDGVSCMIFVSERVFDSTLKTAQANKIQHGTYIILLNILYPEVRRLLLRRQGVFAPVRKAIPHGATYHQSFLHFPFKHRTGLHCLIPILNSSHR